MRWPNTFWGGLASVTLSLIALSLADALLGQSAALAPAAGAAVLFGAAWLASILEERLASRLATRLTASAAPIPPVQPLSVAGRPGGRAPARSGDAGPVRPGGAVPGRLRAGGRRGPRPGKTRRPRP